MTRTIHRLFIRWGLPLFALVGVLAMLPLAQRGWAASDALPEAATIPYSHRVHVQEAGIDCLFCHSKAIRSPQAGLPSLQKCMVCHEYITVDEPQAQQQIEQVKQAFAEGRRVQWPDVYRQPDFVYFSHRPHVNNAVACETCHGDVQSMDLVEKQVEMNMGFCLNCHRRQSEEIQPRLLDCVTCHK